MKRHRPELGYGSLTSSEVTGVGGDVGDVGAVDI
jgi:hypothetical protein